MPNQIIKNIKRVLITGISSGSGKTTIVCAILGELKRRGLRLSACKCGPDYIDPMFHRAVMGAKTANLDLFFTDEQKVRDIVYETSIDTDITVMEGVMGYYDGIQFGKDTASSYDVAKRTKTPVILVISCKGMSLSIAAVVKGVKEFREDSNIQGLILNGITKGLYERLKPMLEEETKISVVGYLPPLKNFNLESRHLGLITPSEMSDLQEQLEYLHEVTKNSLDIESIINIANNAVDLEISEEVNMTNEFKGNASKEELYKRKLRIGYAYDQAFCFYYQENLHMLSKMGAELIAFSPIKDTRLPEQLDGLLLGGGYPELYAKELTDNKSMLKEISTVIHDGLPCIAECGGFMYLHERMQGKDGSWYQMVGTIEGDSFQTDQLVRFGYITLTAKQGSAFLQQGEEIRGHEFHYWDSTNTGDAVQATKASNGVTYPTIHAKDTLWAGYPHIYYNSNPTFVRNFIKMCRREN